MILRYTISSRLVVWLSIQLFLHYCYYVRIAESFVFSTGSPKQRQGLDTNNHNIGVGRTTNTECFVHRPQDFEISFGSSSEGAMNYGEEDDDDNDTKENNAQIVSKLIKEQEMDDKLERKRNTWGKFANATNTDEFNSILEEERKKVDEEFQRYQNMAEQVGVNLQVLEPKDDIEYNDDYTDSNSKTNNNADVDNRIRISKANDSPTSTSSSPWFAEIDEELSDEWKALTEGDTNNNNNNIKKQKSNKDIDDDDVSDDDDDDDNNNNISPDDVIQNKYTGKMVVREKLSGVRVGSAGGWTLEIFPGDYVVHRKYGIGRYVKTCLQSKTKLTKDEKLQQSERRAEILTKKLREKQQQMKGRGSITPDMIQEIRSTFGTELDTDPISNPQIAVLEISYADAVVHVPIDRAYRLSRYRAGDTVIKPKLSRVRGEAWSKAKQKVEANTLQLAQDVLALYSTRETLKRPPFDPTLEVQVQEFSKSFPYIPTSDQIKCFEDVENDMVWRNRPMDRLVCGDVGFGKTEVAIRAIFRCIANGKQVAFLAPTGVLAAQHYKNVMKRMGTDTPYNVTMGLLRGNTRHSKAGHALRQSIGSGDVQLIIGTHALLSNDLKFHNLGLLVIDEEQRFGVKQKERLKLICNGIDVLTLSATPIPRTLQMSLSGIRDTSTIRSPPPMRKPTITYVQDFDESIVQLAIQNELQRGGQCYYVVPRISMLETASDMIKRLFPSIRIIMAHGRMYRNGAEENVAEFAEGNYDILLATTVIENGVDIPTVNTIIVQDSQSFGMSTLYQLRGRVGRSDKQAYAYFLHRPESITEQATQRLQAIGELNELGSGFDVANRDLEIRGAGSLLGTEQSGMAAKVGFDLYMRMLKKSIRKLRGLDLPVVPRTNILLPTIKITPTTFTIPSTYMIDDNERKTKESNARLAESTSALVALTNEWKQKYGSLPASLQNQLKIMHLHACTRRLGIDLVGLVNNGNDDNDNDCVLRSPGLRPRHWGTIIDALPNKVAPRGLDVIFPARFTRNGEDDLEIIGGKKIDLQTLLEDDSNSSEDREEESWDVMDQEEIEAMKDISSALNVNTMDEIDIEQYPRLIMKNFDNNNNNSSVDRLLKVLLPISKIVYEKQSEQADNAKAAAALRERQETMKKRKKLAEKQDSLRMGYYN